MAVPTDSAARAKIALTLPANIWDGAGFMPVAVAIQNDSADAREWTVDFEVRSNLNGRGAVGVSSFRFALPPGGNQETVVYVPGPGRGDSTGYTAVLSADVRGPGVSGGRVSVLGNQQMKGVYLAAPAGLTTRLKALSFGVGVTGPRRGGPSGSGFTTLDNAGFAVLEVVPSRWPADWRVWAPFNVVALGADEFNALDSARQAALRDWVALGGRLLLEPATAQAEERVEKIGLGNITTWKGSLQQVFDAGATTETINYLITTPTGAAAQNTAEALQQLVTALGSGNSTQVGGASAGRGGGRRGGPGRRILQPGEPIPPNTPVVTYTTETQTRTIPPNPATLLQPAAPRDQPWIGRFALLTPADFSAAVVTKNPLLLVLFLAGFALLVGPVNLFVFAPPGRRHRLFATVPALSLLASLGLGAVIVLGDGFGGSGARRALVVLLPGENRAAVFQEQVARTGVLLGRDFALPADTAATLTRADSGEEGFNDPAPDARLRRDGDAASGDWFRSRLRQAHALWRIAPTRARVELVAGGTGGATPVVQSSLGTALRDFVYLDRDGKAWTAESLPQGQRVTLKADAQAWREHAVARMTNGQFDPAAREPEFEPGTEEFSKMELLRYVRSKIEEYKQRGQIPPPNFTADKDRLENELGLKTKPDPNAPLRDNRERGHFYALGGPGDLAPLAASSSIRWNAESVIYTGRLEAARAP